MKHTEALENRIDPEMDRKLASQSKDHIPGWGMDADPENDPTYPMKQRNGADYERIHYKKAPQQHYNGEVFHSIERTGLTRVFGTSTPPAGVSGAIRKQAYKYSEATAAHWMTLILADRVDVVQGIVNDLKNGTVPNLFSEWGWRAEWQHNRPRFLKKMLIRTAVVVLALTWLRRKRK